MFIKNNIGQDQDNYYHESEFDRQSSTHSVQNKVPVIVNARVSCGQRFTGRGAKVNKTVKRSDRVLNALSLPVVINLNPRSAYGKEQEIKTLITQLNCSICTISESWNRTDYPLSDLIKMDNYKVVTNVKERDARGGKPAILVDESRYTIKELCPNEISVPVGVEAVWILVRNKNISSNNKIKNMLLLLCWSKINPKESFV